VADTRIDDLRRRLERDPGSRLFAQLAEELRKAGELAEAIRVSRAGLALHPSYPSARLTLGRALLESGDATSARAELESALRDAPDNILASRFLGQAREGLGDLKGAAEQYQKTLLMAPGDRQLQGQLVAVESRLKTASGDPAQGAAETTPPVARRTPPPLPPGPTTTAEIATPARGTAGAVSPVAPPSSGPPRAGAPPVVFAPSRPLVPAVQKGAEAGPGESTDLPATLRIRSSQIAAPPPPSPPLRPEPAAPLEVAAAAVATPPDEPTLPLRAGPVVGVEPGAPFSSSTLAELYFQQGLVDRAKDVYRQLLDQDPANDKARERLSELENAAPVADERAARRRTLERTIAGLETLLAAVRRR